MLDTTFVMVVSWDGSEWDCSCHVMDPIWHMAKEDAKAESEAPTAAKASEPEQAEDPPGGHGVENKRALGNIIPSSSGIAKAEVTSASCCQGQAHWHAW